MTEPSQKTYVNLSPGRGASSSREDDLYKAVQATVASDYELLGELGRGDRGRVVYLARELASGSLVALRLDRGGASEAEYELTVLPHLDETVPSAGSACPYCGKHVRDWARFCPHCGRDISGEAEADSGSGFSTAQLLQAVRESAADEYEVLVEMPRARGGGRVYFARDLATGAIIALRLHREKNTDSGPDQFSLGRTQVLKPLVADLGATSIDVAVTTLDGRILGHHDEPARIEAGPERCLDRVDALVGSLLQTTEALPGRLWGIGIGVPGPVEFEAGRPISPPIMPGWDGYPIRERFAERYGAPVWVDNDVNVLALGESRSGVAAGHRDVVVVKLGTGIGAGIISDGRLHRGAQSCVEQCRHMRSEPVFQVALLLQPALEERLDPVLRFRPRQRGRKRVAAVEEPVDGRQRHVVDQLLRGSDGAPIERGDASSEPVDESVQLVVRK